jgi:hypothetical protein
MRAKFAVALAAFGLLVASQPSFAMNHTLREVSRILYGDRAIVLTQSAVIAPGTTVVSTPLATDTTTTIIREIPAVLAPTSAGVAIITEIPSDLDIRREDLSRKIDVALVGGGLNSAEATELKTALGQVGTAEVSMRQDGMLDRKESRRLYKAMDKIASDLDSYVEGDGYLLGFRFE